MGKTRIDEDIVHVEATYPNYLPGPQKFPGNAVLSLRLGPPLVVVIGGHPGEVAVF